MSNRTSTADGRDQSPDEPFAKKEEDQPAAEQGKGHGPLKGTDTPATTAAEHAEREHGKRTTM